MFTVTILPAAITFDVLPELQETILQAALRNGVDMPYRCQQGVCTACVCKKISGDINYGQVELKNLMLSAGTAQSYAYPCIGYPLTDITLHHPFIK